MQDGSDKLVGAGSSKPSLLATAKSSSPIQRSRPGSLQFLFVRLGIMLSTPAPPCYGKLAHPVATCDAHLSIQEHHIKACRA